MKETILNRVLITEQLLNMFKLCCEWSLSYKLSITKSDCSDEGCPGRLFGLIFTGYVPLTSQNPYPLKVYSVAKYRPHLSHFWENVIFAIQLGNFLFKPFN